MDIRIEGERKALAALMKIPRRATVEIRNNIHTLIFHCDGCGKEMQAGLHCTVCTDFDLCSPCYTRNGHQHRMERFSTSQNAPGQRTDTNNIQKELQAPSVISPVCSQTGQTFVEQLDDPQTNGTMVKQEVKIKIDRHNRMQISACCQVKSCTDILTVPSRYTGIMKFCTT